VRVNAHDLSDNAVDTVCAHVYASLGEAVLMSVHCLAFLSMIWPEAHPSSGLFAQEYLVIGLPYHGGLTV
jgi:hypothetical protein